MKRTLEMKIFLILWGVLILTITISCQKYQSYTGDPIASNQIYNISEAPQPTGSVSYNAELIKQPSPSMQAKI
jgi:hypothetical protein